MRKHDRAGGGVVNDNEHAHEVLIGFLLCRIKTWPSGLGHYWQVGKLSGWANGARLEAVLAAKQTLLARKVSP